MTNYTAKNRNEETVELFSNDTFTLAFGNPEEEMEESTPASLHQVFDSVAIAGLMGRVGLYSQEYAKLQAAWDLGEI